MATLLLAFSLLLLCNRIEASAPELELHIAPPIAGLRISDLHDSFDEMHFGHRHEAIDIMEPLGTPIHAVDDGTIRKLFLSRAGGTTIYQFDSAGSYCYYYAHLDRYAENLHEGMPVSLGQIIGYVGTTGDASPDAPQLHFAIFRLDTEKKWWKGTPINPYPILLQALKRE
jgi:peptidoglycan LD-endopeptidase LytH